MQKANELQTILRRIDHKGYPAYKDTRGAYQFGNYVLSIDHVQGDPFASPSKVSIHIRGNVAGFPRNLWEKRCRRLAVQDYLLRVFGKKVDDYSFRAKGSGKSGLMSVSRPGQEVLERSACEIHPQNGEITLRMEIGFPANGRTVNARELEKMLFDFLPDCVNETLMFDSADAKRIGSVADLAEDQQYIRDHLKEFGLVAFIANGAILPRESGVSGRPMKKAVPFVSPKELEVSMVLPYHGAITGMGIKKGVTLIVGGGYHGKSTLLKALELGVYNHIRGDGREFVITDESAVKLRAEDGRSIKNVDISMFINNLPNGKDTKKFCTEDASGSTSQAANMVEAMEAGAKTFLIDEDTSATNFMIRDELMQRVVNRSDEPITPFIDRIRELYDAYGISTVLVAGSSGSYFHTADRIIQMNQYEPVVITEAAKQAAGEFPLPKQEAVPADKPDFGRRVRPDRSFREEARFKLKTTGRDAVTVNKETIDVRYVEQLVDSEQLAMLGFVMKYVQCRVFDGKKTLQQAVEEVWKEIGAKGMSLLVDGNYIPTGLAAVRKQEIYACINRYRRLGL